MESIDRRDVTRRTFLEAAGAAGATLGAAGCAAASAAAEPAGAPPPRKGLGIGINLEYVRHADKSLAYGVKRAGEIGFKYVEPCFLMGRCLLSEGGYCHVTSMDTEPKRIRDMAAEAGVAISALSSHSDLLDPEFGVLYARRGISTV